MPVWRNSPSACSGSRSGLALGAAVLLGLARRTAGAPGRADGRRVRGRLRQSEHQDQDQGGRPGDDAQPAAGTGADPLARLGLSGVLLLQELHHAGLLPRPRRGLRGRGKAALRAGAGVADARAVRRRHHAAALRYRRRLSDLLDRLAQHASTFRSTSCSARASSCAPASAIRSASSAASCCTAPIR